MIIDEAIKHAEEVADTKLQDAELSEIQGCYNNAKKCYACAEEHRQLAEWLKELKKLRGQTRWIPVDERLPEENEEYHSFFVTDSNGDISIAKFYLPLNPDIDKPYWSGLTDVIAWMPVFIEPYNAESEEV